MTSDEQAVARPRLTFFCELQPKAVAALFDTPDVIETLQALEATVSLGLLDLSAERAKVVRRLNDAGIPLVAWLLLPKEAGYWFHAGNVARAVAQYDAFEQWTARHGLHWAGVGLDVEPDYREMKQMATGGARQVLPRIVGRLFSGRAVGRAEAIYADLVARARAAGYRVETYQIPIMVDERQAGSHLLRRAVQLVDVASDAEVLMLYTSLARSLGPGLLWSYGRHAGGIGVGSTGGGVDLTGPDLAMSWEELARDLRLAWRWTDDVYVFSLEGSVAHGYLARLVDFDWDVAIEPPLTGARRVDRLRGVLRAALWASTHPGWVLGMVAMVWLIGRRLSPVIARETPCPAGRHEG